MYMDSLIDFKLAYKIVWAWTSNVNPVKVVSLKHACTTFTWMKPFVLWVKSFKTDFHICSFVDPMCILQAIINSDIKEVTTAWKKKHEFTSITQNKSFKTWMDFKKYVKRRLFFGASKNWYRLRLFIWQHFCTSFMFCSFVLCTWWAFM